jgi:hypothetical protein
MTYDYLIVHQTQFFGEKVVWLADFEQAKKIANEMGDCVLAKVIKRY